MYELILELEKRIESDKLLKHDILYGSSDWYFYTGKISANNLTLGKIKKLLNN